MRKIDFLRFLTSLIAAIAGAVLGLGFLPIAMSTLILPIPAEPWGTILTLWCVASYVILTAGPLFLVLVSLWKVWGDRRFLGMHKVWSIVIMVISLSLTAVIILDSQNLIFYRTALRDQLMFAIYLTYAIIAISMGMYTLNSKRS